MPVLLVDSPSSAADTEQVVTDILHQDASQQDLAVEVIDQEKLRDQAQSELSTTLKDGTTLSVSMPDLEGQEINPYLEKLLDKGVRLVEPTDTDLAKMNSILTKQADRSRLLREHIGSYCQTGEQVSLVFGANTAGDKLKLGNVSVKLNSAYFGSVSDIVRDSDYTSTTDYADSYEAWSLRRHNSSLVAPELHLPGDQFKDQFRPYSIHSFKTEKGDWAVVVYDHIQDQPLVELYVNRDIDYRVFSGITKLRSYARTVMGSTYNNQYENYQTTINHWAMADPSSQPTVISTDPNSQITEESFLNLMNACTNSEAKLSFVGSGLEFDITSHLSLNSDRLSKAGGGPIICDGQIRLVEIKEPIFTSDEQSAYLRSYRADSYGNLARFPIKAGVRHFEVNFPITFLEQASDTPVYVPVSMDLSAIGSGQVSNAFYHRALSPIGEQGEIKFYTNMDEHQVVGDYENSFSDIVTGIESGLSLFGQADDVKRVLIANGFTENAFFIDTNPHAICLLDELLESNSNLSVVACHETVHLLDCKYGYALSGGKFEKVFNHLSAREASFLHEICESEFLPNMENAGHAFDNSRELLSSAVSSLQHPEWSQVVGQRDLEFVKDYTTVLTALRLNARGIDGIPDDAPIVSLLHERIAELRDLERSKRREKRREEKVLTQR